MNEPNTARGEAGFSVRGRMLLLRPSFAALVAAESELGSLLALTDRAGAGGLLLSEMAALIWHCLAERDGLAREDIGEALVAEGVGAALPTLRAIFRQVLAGSA